jgi:hypothetical protein
MADGAAVIVAAFLGDAPEDRGLRTRQNDDPRKHTKMEPIICSGNFVSVGGSFWSEHKRHKSSPIYNYPRVINLADTLARRII